MAETGSQPTGGKKKKIGEHEVEHSPLDTLRENAGTMIAIIVAVTLVSVLLVYQSEQDTARDDAAWAKLGEVRSVNATGVEGFEELAKSYGDSSAGPFIKIAWASRLYETGVRGDVEKALELYKQVQKATRDNPQLKRVLPEVIETIEAELKAENAPLRADAVKQPEGDGASDPFGDDSFDEHAGHDHGPGEHGAETPEDGGTPEDSGAETPEDGGVETPEDSGAETPEDGGVETPEDGDAETPEDGDAETPEDGDAETPEDGEGDSGSGE